MWFNHIFFIKIEIHFGRTILILKIGKKLYAGRSNKGRGGVKGIDDLCN